jgi:hypothetical protein
MKKTDTASCIGNDLKLFCWSREEAGEVMATEATTPIRDGTMVCVCVCVCVKKISREKTTPAPSASQKQLLLDHQNRLLPFAAH